MVKIVRWHRPVSIVNQTTYCSDTDASKIEFCKWKVVIYWYFEALDGP